MTLQRVYAWSLLVCVGIPFAGFLLWAFTPIIANNPVIPSFFIIVAATVIAIFALGRVWLEAVFAIAVEVSFVHLHLSHLPPEGGFDNAAVFTASFLIAGLVWAVRGIYRGYNPPMAEFDPSEL